MYRAVKQGIKKLLADRQRGKYDKLLEKKTVTYDTWIRKREQERNKDKEEEGAEKTRKKSSNRSST